MLPSTGQQQEWTVDVAGLIELLKENTYRHNDVAVRELVANAADSFTQLGTQYSQEGAAIRIRIERVELTPLVPDNSDERLLRSPQPDAAKIPTDCLVIEDNGIGMTEGDLTNIFGRVAASAKRLLEKTLNPGLMQQDLIGRFGIGRLAAFLIANRMIVETCPRNGSGDALRWEGTTSGYWIGRCDRTEVGTKVLLELREDVKREFLDLEVLRSIVARDFRNVFYPVYVGESRDPVNRLRAPWYEQGPESMSLERYEQYLLQLAASEGPFRDAADPLLVIPIEHAGTDTKIHLRGVLYVPRDPHFSLKHHSTVEIYSRGVFVTRRDHRLIPLGLDFVKGVVESRDLTLNANRQEIQYDRNFTRVQNLIRRTVLTHLMGLTQSQDQQDKALFAFIVQAHRGRIVQGACEDAALFDEICEYIPFGTNDPDGPLTTLDTYLARSGKGRIEYTRRRPSQGRLEPLLGDLEGDLLVVNDDDDVRLIQQYARKKGLEYYEIESAAEILAERLLAVEAPHNGWKAMVSFFDDDLEHRDHEIETRLCRMKNSLVPAAVSPDPKRDRGTFQDLLLDDVRKREGDLDAARKDLSPSRQRRRNLILYLNLENDGLDRLARLIANNKGKTSFFREVLHEIFHYAMEFSEWPLPVDHVCQQHTKMIKEFAIAVEAQGNLIGIEVRLREEQEKLAVADHALQAAQLEAHDARIKAEGLENAHQSLFSELEAARTKLSTSSKQDRHSLCFLAFPFRGYEELVDALRRILERPPYYWQVVVASDVSLEPTIDDNVMRHIRMADYFLAEISDLNSNVMMELGMMLMISDRPLGLLRKADAKKIPANLNGYLTINYGSRGTNATPDEFVEELREMLRKDARFQPRGDNDERFLSRYLFENEDEIPEGVVDSITSQFKTIEEFLAADVDQIVERTKLRPGSIQNVRGLLEPHKKP